MSGRLASMLLRCGIGAAVAATVSVALHAYLRPDSVMSLLQLMSWC